MRWVAPGLVLVVSMQVFAQSRPEVMPLLVIRRAPPSADREKVQREFVRQLKIAGAAVPDFARFEAALGETKGLDCERDDACAVKLATKAQVL